MRIIFSKKPFPFCHPVTRRPRRHTCTAKGAAGGSKHAQKVMAAVAAACLEATQSIKIFVCCDEGISPDNNKLVSFPQRLVCVLTLMCLGFVLNFPKCDRKSPAQKRVFIGVMASTDPLRVSPSPGRLRIIRARASRVLEAIKTGRRTTSGTLLRQLLGSARSCLRPRQTVALWTIKINAVVRQHGMRHGQSKQQFAALLDRICGAVGPECAAMDCGGDPVSWRTVALSWSGDSPWPRPTPTTSS